MARRIVSLCASCILLSLAIASILGPSAVKADIADAMPAFVSRPVTGIPLCAAHEELCPVSRGSNDLHVSVAAYCLRMTSTAMFGQYLEDTLTDFRPFKRNVSCAVRRPSGSKDLRWMRYRWRRSRLHFGPRRVHAAVYSQRTMYGMPVSSSYV